VWPVAQEREIHAQLVGESRGGKWRINADAQNLGTCFRNLILEIAEGRKFVRSPASKGQRVEGENDGLASQLIAKCDCIAATVW
jgi:hypothetical protein